MGADGLEEDQCSINQLPFPATAFYITVEGLTESMQCDEWHHVECIRSLDQGTKTVINAMQKKHFFQ